MASEVAIAQALDTIAAAFNRHPSWVARCVPLWEREFAARTDGQLDRALRMWIRGQAKAPTMAELHQIMDGERRSGAPGQVNVEGCADCDGSGWRYAAWHRVENDPGLSQRYLWSQDGRHPKGMAGPPRDHRYLCDRPGQPPADARGARAKR